MGWLRPVTYAWLLGAGFGVGLCVLALGIGGRVAMRIIALATGLTPLFEVKGTLTVVAAGRPLVPGVACSKT